MSSDLMSGNVSTVEPALGHDHEALPPKKRKISFESYLPDYTSPDGIISASFVLAGLNTPLKSPGSPVDAGTPAKKLCSSEKILNKSQKAQKGFKQIRYDPPLFDGVPMSSKEKAVWRREQRRMRNRESAAASRKKTRDRISGLENELKKWKDKYEGALMKLKTLEEDRSASLHQTAIFKNVHHMKKNIVSPLTIPMVVPPTNVEDFSLPAAEIS